MPSTQKILEDLYLIDPTLRAHEAKLIALIDELLRSKPDTRFDEAFARELKTKILLREPAKTSFWSTLALPKFAFAGGFIVLVVAVTALVVQKQHGTSGTSTLALQFGQREVSMVSHDAFGSLSGAQGNQATDAIAPLGSAPAPTAAVRLGSGETSVGSATSKAMAPNMIVAPYFNYTLVYKGDTFTLPDQTLNVYKRVKSTNGNTSLAEALMNAPLAGINLKTFTGAGLTNFTLADPSANGYSINVDLREGTIGINGGQQPVIMPMVCKPDGSCSNQDQLTLKDVPPDSDLIALANNFIHSHGIDVSAYAKPEVDTSWKTNAQPDQPLYVPDTINVRYPLLMDNQPVYDQSGSKFGINVTVNIRTKSVVSVWQIQSQDYQASSYSAITDPDQMIKTAEAGGGTGGIYYFGGDSKKTELDLGTPDHVYVTVWNYHDNVSDELYVPALRFPIINAPQGLYRQNVIVPLIKDFMAGNNPGPIRYMEGTSGSAGTVTPL